MHTTSLPYLHGVRKKPKLRSDIVAIDSDSSDFVGINNLLLDQYYNS